MRRTLATVLVLLLSHAVAGAAKAQTAASADLRTQHIERVKNQRLSGDVFARFTGLTLEQCEHTCLSDPQCVAVEHFRAEGRIIGRGALCRLFTTAGVARSSRFSDIGYKRQGARRDP